MGRGQRVGYIRVSSVGQNPARQLDGAELDRVFTDTVSGKSAARPQLQAILAYVPGAPPWMDKALSWLAEKPA